MAQRCFDRGCCSKNSRGEFNCLETNRRKTKKSDINRYADLYSGPTLNVAAIYSRVLTIVFVTFMYGFGLPILYPIAALSLLLLYATEKANLYWGY
jgi:hypothetical protein